MSLDLESISSSGLASFHYRDREPKLKEYQHVIILFNERGANMDWTMNLCLLFSLGS
uniref:Uncharacterized protein n=1 Tax=Anabas testudineus TaxID=64144 RepID=A0A3Q1KIH7_ANATE